MSTKNAGLVALSMAAAGIAAPAEAQEAPKAQSHFTEGDIVRGNTPDGVTGPVCVLVNQFMRRENVIFRIRVRDVAGKPLDDRALKGIVVELADGQKFQARYAPRPPQGVITAMGLPGPTDAFWTAAWRIAENYPTGTLSYKVTATDAQGAVQDWKTFNDPRSLPTIVDGEAKFVKPPAR